MDPTTGNIVCQKGWTVVSKAEDGSVSECVLCDLGRYASVDARNKLILDRYGNSVCKPCPANHYLSSKYGMGLSSCEKCPEGQTTNGREGASSLEQCLCPSRKAKMNGKCQECSPTQFADPKNSSRCIDCPANSFASLGSDRCLCKPGFYKNTKEICTLCPQGKYTMPQPSVSSNDKCFSCPDASTTASYGQIGLNSCNVCAPGFVFRTNVGCVQES